MAGTAYATGVPAKVTVHRRAGTATEAFVGIHKTDALFLSDPAITAPIGPV